MYLNHEHNLIFILSNLISVHVAELHCADKMSMYAHVLAIISKNGFNFVHFDVSLLCMSNFHPRIFPYGALKLKPLSI